jgi:hypothetical protein
MAPRILTHDKILDHAPAKTGGLIASLMLGVWPGLAHRILNIPLRKQ